MSHPFTRRFLSDDAASHHLLYLLSHQLFLTTKILSQRKWDLRHDRLARKGFTQQPNTSSLGPQCRLVRTVVRSLPITSCHLCAQQRLWHAWASQSWSWITRPWISASLHRPVASPTEHGTGIPDSQSTLSGTLMVRCGIQPLLPAKPLRVGTNTDEQDVVGGGWQG